jgi:succinoglycan biosynthesis transport protein ExoP
MAVGRNRILVTSVIDYARAIWRRRVTVLLTVIVTVAASVGYDLLKTPVYTATSAMRITPLVASSVLEANNSALLASSQPVDVPTAIQVIESSAVQTLARATVTKAPPVGASQVGTTDVVDLAVTSPRASLAAQAANAYANAYIKLERNVSVDALNGASTSVQRQIAALAAEAKALQTKLSAAPPANQASLYSQELLSVEGPLATLRQQLANYQTAAALSTGGAQVVGAADTPQSPSAPRPEKNAALAAFFGLVLGCALALVREQLDQSVRTADELASASAPYPVLAEIPEFEGARANQRLPMLASPASAVSEAYRTLRTALQFAATNSGLTTLQITSASPGDGKSSTAANLAIAVAQADRHVVLVDCDLRRPCLHQLFQTTNVAGLSNALIGELDVLDVIQASPIFPGVSIVPSGPHAPNPAELLQSGRLAGILDTLRETYDLVILDSPPLLPVTDSAIVASHVDGVLLVAASQSSRRRDIAASIEKLRQARVAVVGTVMNRVSLSRGDRYSAYYTHETVS